MPFRSPKRSNSTAAATHTAAKGTGAVPCRAEGYLSVTIPGEASMPLAAISGGLLSPPPSSSPSSHTPRVTPGLGPLYAPAGNTSTSQQAPQNLAASTTPHVPSSSSQAANVDHALSEDTQGFPNEDLLETVPYGTTEGVAAADTQSLPLEFNYF